MKRLASLAGAVVVSVGCGQTQAHEARDARGAGLPSTTSHETAPTIDSNGESVGVLPARRPIEKGATPPVASSAPAAEEPAYEAVVLGVATPTSPVPGIATTLATLRDQSRACYTQVSARHSGAGGRLRVTFVIAPSGDVKTATIVANGGLPKALAECVVEHARRARFQAPDGSKEVAMSLWIAFGGAAP